ncbi:putative iron-regulated protein [Variovorax boronicumulans]|uniref:ChaN family lipoprotein n=1 Tax=Variovorax TaxID=34072 RepID=UPI002781ADB7|nr:MULTISPECIES: ChaN family lipoprotein [Variovorax]MDQ0037197.1 putative iron-regulated protein [Variovorax boronicumulans]MDQ0612337.1 putative iron-regulated protein [Variovorax sp. W1I1]
MLFQRWPARAPRFLIPLLAAAALAACSPSRLFPLGPDAPVAKRVSALLPVDALLLGEQHDAPEHHAIERETIEALAARNQLAALALEMAEEGRSTAQLAPSASEAQVQTALGWSDKAWPWANYGPVVMAAVRAGVPVVGANLPRARMKDAMADVSLDVQLNGEAYTAQQDAVREGHCKLLPESQIIPMTRIQVGRDRAMAQTIVKSRQPGKTVLLIAGAGHTVRTLGVPQHLPDDVKVTSVRLLASATNNVVAGDYDKTWLTPPLLEKDYCAELRRPANKANAAS